MLDPCLLFSLLKKISMKNSDGPGQNQTTSGKTSKTSDKERSRKDGDTATGPNWDKKSKGAEGATGQNAGVFK